MAFFDTKAVTAFHPTETLSAFVEALKLGLAQYREYKDTCRVMQSLSNRELDDIGVRRTDISALALKHVYGD